MSYSYVITRDYGFAPNPFHGYCTLATCKPNIRKAANVGDCVIGTGSANQKVCRGNQLLFAMCVEEKLTYKDYWNDIRFQIKKPIMNASKKYLYGDNIYCFDDSQNRLVQQDSHHSHPDGTENMKNYNRDTNGKYVLISKTFWYFGREAPTIPKYLIPDIVKCGRGYKKITDDNAIVMMVDWLTSISKQGCCGSPLEFDRDFKRYNGT